MFELISQIPFHFTTSLCSLMDPIYYIYHKLYHIFGDRVGHCHQACLRVHTVAPADVWERCGTRLPFFSQMHFSRHLLQIKTSRSRPVKARWQCRRDDGPINLTPLLYVQTTRKRRTCAQKTDTREGEEKLMAFWLDSVQPRHSQPWSEWFKSVVPPRSNPPPPPFRSSFCVLIIHFSKWLWCTFNTWS